MITDDVAREHASSFEPHAADDDWHRPWLGAALVGAVGAVLVVGVVHLPRERAQLPEIARHAMAIAVPQWGTTEPVNEVVYGSRGFDTFGETFLLLAAVVSVMLLSRSRERRAEYVGESAAGRAERRADDPPGDGVDLSEQQARAAEQDEQSGGEPPADPDSTRLGSYVPERAEAMTVVVRMAARMVAVILPVAGVYLAAWGYTPGGGFPAGAALVGVLLLLYAAMGRRAVRRVARPALLEAVEMVGAALIIAIGVIGIAAKGSMFANWLPLAQQQTIRAGGTLQPFSGAELIEVATGLAIAVFALLGMEHDWTPDDSSEESDGDHDQDDRT